MQLDVDALLKRVPSKYEMVVLAARRARQLVDGAKPLLPTRAANPVTVAFEEMTAGLLEYRKDGEEE
ncbi:MAG: DNA-directed RNA polymerase subunit omega [Thermaerobacter sp.]|nr:DNA-directed RNA polymerase subunit omega [Bacillota bacterium]REJ33094.1 MAG: DNA-directed RNA polymerase subunit omega [Bacillota bacterium]